VKLPGVASDWGAGTGNIYCTLNTSDEIAIRFKFWKEDAAAFDLWHGNGTKCLHVKMATNETIYYSESNSTGKSCKKDAWDDLEIKNIRWASYLMDLYYTGDALCKSDCSFINDASANNKIALYSRNGGVGNDSYIDCFIVRNFRATEPAWGSWGAEEYDGSFTTESAVASATMDGITQIESTTESAEATDTFDGYSLSISTTESAEATDTFGNEITAYGPTTESAEVTDSMDALHLVDSITESAVVSGSMEAEEIIRKRIRFPNLQGKHLSLKFTSATDGSFAIYYLRHKMFKTRELCSDQKHPNTQGSHIGVKLSNSGSDAFTLMYVSQEMQLVTS